MHKIDFTTSGRSMRWYEWVAGLALFALACGVRAESVYKCTDADGGVAYQGQPCSDQQREHVLALAPAPAYAPSPEYRTNDAREPHASMGRQLSSRQPSTRGAGMSYECTVSNGEVFYQHSPCPRSVSADKAEQKSNGKAHGHSPNHASNSNAKLTVTSRVVTREEACSQIHRAGAIGRNGRARDEDVSTYERNLGHDPCR